MKVRRQPTAIWMDTECHQLRRHLRMLEHRYRRTKSPADRQAWVEHERKRHCTYHNKESIYWNHRFAGYSKQPSKLWQSMSTLLDTRQRITSKSNCQSAQDLLNFLIEKVAAVRRDTVGQTLSIFLPPAPATIDEFQPLSADNIQNVCFNHIVCPWSAANTRSQRISTGITPIYV